MDFAFFTDSRSRHFCESIASEMSALFGISAEEAVGRINRAWSGLSIIGDDIVHHEDEEFWAFNIYYGHDSFWWKNPPDLKPLPFP